MSLRNLAVLCVLAAAAAAGCAGGAEDEQVAVSPRINVSYDKYEPVHSKVTRQLSEPVVDAMVKNLGGDDHFTRDIALEDLVVIGSRDKRVIGKIIAGLTDQDPRIREYCLIALGKIGGPAKDRTPADKVGQNLMDQDDLVKCAALFCIGNLGIRSREMYKAAFEYLSHPNPSVRSFAAECIRKVKYWPAIPALIYNHLAAENAPQEFRLIACEALENITLEKVDAVPSTNDVEALLAARAEAWIAWWEANRERFEG